MKRKGGAVAWTYRRRLQTILEEGSDEILLAYQDTLHGNPAQDYGASATIGLESPDGSLGSQFLHNQPLLAPHQATTALR